MRRPATPGRYRACALGFALLACWTACATGWRIEDSKQPVPSLSTEEARLLADVNPYVIAFDDTLTPFLCRWQTPATLGVALDADASVEDRRVIEMALRAWEQAGLGLRFEIGAEPAAIEVGFTAPEGYSGATRADCEVGESPGGALEAWLVAARLLVRRVDVDALGRPLPLTPEERLGSALHEIGHALGFQGHPRRGDTVMLRSVDHVRRAGRRALQGEAFRDPALAALYRLRSGTRLGSFELPGGRTRELDALRALASGLGYRGPLARVGDRDARIAWNRPGAVDPHFLLPEISSVYDDPRRFRAIPGPGVRGLLARGAEVVPDSMPRRGPASGVPEPESSRRGFSRLRLAPHLAEFSGEFPVARVERASGPEMLLRAR